MYENSGYRIRVDEYLSPRFVADVGVEQGCCLCPALSNIYILTSIVLLHVKRKQGYHPLLHVLFVNTVTKLSNSSYERVKILQPIEMTFIRILMHL